MFSPASDAGPTDHVASRRLSCFQHPGTERRPVVLPRDLCAHPEAETEWWYYNGHLDAEGRPLGFQLVFFRQRSDRIRLARVIPARALMGTRYFAHFCLTDPAARTFRYRHTRARAGRGGAADDRYQVWLGDWSAGEEDGIHRLRAGMRGAEMDIALRPAKSPVLHGDRGWIEKADHRHSCHFSYPRMKVAGSLRLDGQLRSVRGDAWMDREFGNVLFCSQLHCWDWCAMQLDDGREIMFYLLRDQARRLSSHSALVLIQPDSTPVRLRCDEFCVTARGSWTSPVTGVTYPMQWLVEVPRFGLSLEVSPVMNHQEVDTRGTTGVIYWEGAVAVEGSLGTGRVSGRGYAELAGYEQSRRRIGQFDFQTYSIGPLHWLANEMRWLQFLGGRTLTQVEPIPR